MSHRLTRSTKVHVDKEGETPESKKQNLGGMVILESLSFHIAAVRGLRRACVILHVAAIAVDVQRLGVLLRLNLKVILSFILSLPQIGSTLVFFIFYRQGRKINFNFIFVRNSINISPCAEPMRREAFFFILEKISAPATR